MPDSPIDRSEHIDEVSTVLIVKGLQTNDAAPLAQPKLRTSRSGSNMSTVPVPIRTASIATNPNRTCAAPDVNV